MAFQEQLKRLVEEMGKISNELKEVKSGNQDNLNARVDAIEKSFVDLSSRVCEFVANVSSKLSIMEDKYDHLEQYSRRNCLVIHGVPEKPGEVVTDLCTNLFEQKLNIVIPPEAIDRAHRLGKVKTTAASVMKNGSRPIIIKFTGYGTRHKVFSAKKALKGTKILITESLTYQRLQILQEAKQIYGQNLVWTSDGNIIVLIDGKKHYITSLSSLHILPKPTSENFSFHHNNFPKRNLRSNKTQN